MQIKNMNGHKKYRGDRWGASLDVTISKIFSRVLICRREFKVTRKTLLGDSNDF